MLKQRALVAFSASLVIGFLLAPLMDGQAGEKKKEDKKAEKKKDAKKTEPIFSKTDELTDKDEKDTNVLVANSPRKVYKVKLAEGKTYQIDLKSKDFDAFLRLEDPAGKELAFNDDVPGEKTLDSRIVHKAAKTGEYRIIATAFDSKMGKLTGKFTLTVVETGSGASGSIFTAKGMELKLKDGKARYEGELTAKDPAVLDHYYKLFTVKLEEGKTYRIDHRDNGDDPKFDPFLFLEDADGNKLAEDDDSGGALNSRIVHKAAKTGVYRIIATTLPGKQTGKFVLEIAVEAKDAKKTDAEQTRLDKPDSLRPALLSARRPDR